MCTFRSIAFGALVYFFFVTSTAVAGTATLTIDRIKKNGGPVDIKYILTVRGKTTTTAKSFTVSAANNNNTTTKFATDVASAFTGATSNGNVVSLPDPATGGSGAFLDKANDFVLSHTNIDNRLGALPPTNQPYAVLSFLPNDTNGQNTLAADSTITAGFGAGLSQVSFTASAGTSLPGLTSQLNSSLGAAGYSTQMLDPTDILVYTQGLALPDEIDLSVDSSTNIGSLGIEYEAAAPLVSANAPLPVWTYYFLALLLMGMMLRPGALSHSKT
jgi:hypothetical protein